MSEVATLRLTVDNAMRTLDELMVPRAEEDDGGVREFTLSERIRGFWPYPAEGSVRALATEAHAIAKANGFNTPTSFDEVDPIARCLALIHAEVSEALEALRNDDPDNFTEELADVVIRVFDLSAAMSIDLQWAIEAKMEANRSRGYRHGGKRA